jgi:quinolinate synthase
MDLSLELMPDRYRAMEEPELVERIQQRKQELGRDLIILTHHYQRQAIVDLGDFRGDSYGLSRQAASQAQARYLVFCGVHFMAEAAAVLARPDQSVFLPELRAGCPMADMAAIEQVERAWLEIEQAAGPGRTVPLTYMNSSAELKAFCGRNAGAVCTSSNAPAAFDWAFQRGEKILFFPDEHLGRNTATKKRIDPVLVWDPGQELGGNSAETIRGARVIVWKGYCHVHTYVTPGHVRRQRAEFPGARVVVHPECAREVVELADAAGSTEFIIRYAREAPEGATVVVGTEIHLVERLAREQAPGKKVVELAYSICPNMYRINLHNLLWVLDGLGKGPEQWVNRVQVDEPLRTEAKLALDRMLEIR